MSRKCNHREGALQLNCHRFAPDMRRDTSTVQESSHYGLDHRVAGGDAAANSSPDEASSTQQDCCRSSGHGSETFLMRTETPSHRELKRETMARFGKHGPMMVIGALEWAKSMDSWCEKERRRSEDGTIRCAVCHCNCDELNDGEPPNLTLARFGRHSQPDLVALCLNHSVMVERMFEGEPGWNGYQDRAVATGTIIKMLAGSSADTADQEPAQ